MLFLFYCTLFNTHWGQSWAKLSQNKNYTYFWLNQCARAPWERRVIKQRRILEYKQLQHHVVEGKQTKLKDTSDLLHNLKQTHAMHKQWIKQQRLLVRLNEKSNYLDVSYDDTLAVGVEEVVSFGIATNYFRNSPLHLGEAGKNMLWKEIKINVTSSQEIGWELPLCGLHFIFWELSVTGKRWIWKCWQRFGNLGFQIRIYVIMWIKYIQKLVF